MSAARAGLQVNEAGEVEAEITFVNVLSRRRKVLEDARHKGDKSTTGDDPSASLSALSTLDDGLSFK
ncbi:hypothetical protein BGZ94_001884 [Podila epigama]|nr:hypothetical protein BGZ94_001884 [Podila epigama]